MAWSTVPAWMLELMREACSHRGLTDHGPVHSDASCVMFICMNTGMEGSDSEKRRAERWRMSSMVYCCSANTYNLYMQPVQSTVPTSLLQPFAGFSPYSADSADDALLYVASSKSPNPATGSMLSCSPCAILIRNIVTTSCIISCPQSLRLRNLQQAITIQHQPHAVVQTHCISPHLIEKVQDKNSLHCPPIVQGNHQSAD